MILTISQLPPRIVLSTGEILSHAMTEDPIKNPSRSGKLVFDLAKIPKFHSGYDTNHDPIARIIIYPSVQLCRTPFALKCIRSLHPHLYRNANTARKVFSFFVKP
jgi:hypothetical protein